ncbi:MAG: tetratricopeptide repeat protein [Actinomycetia bacterium]|nr:tetratricopeptide repeat protein [Actinomycetes bacterium]
MAAGSQVRPREVRVLEGPNLYFRRPAVKIVLDVAPITGAATEQLRAICREMGWSARPGEANSQARQRFAARLAERALRLLARRSGITRVGIRSRPGETLDEVVIAAVWAHRGRGQAAGDHLAGILTALVSGTDLDAALDAAADTVRSALDGEPPLMRTPRIPVASITGTNGKTTTTRMLAHICMTSGLRTAWSSTDGVVVQGELVEPGDYSGPAGARGVLDAPGVQIGILETARGGMLLKGMGVSHNNVSIVTNVAEDHLGMQGIHTVDQLAEVKAIITKVTLPRGWTVLNGSDPRVWAMRHGSPGRPWVFTRDQDAPAVREALDAGGRATTVIDGWVCVLEAGTSPRRLVRLADIPSTMAGLAAHNVANALAAISGGLGLGLDDEAVVAGIQGFRSDAELNPGRLNTFSVPLPAGGSATVIIDMAHNEDGVLALLDVADGLRQPGARCLFAIGMVGDRTDSQLEVIGAIAGQRADLVAIGHKVKYLRGRTAAEIEDLLKLGLSHVGVIPIGSFETELESVQALLERAADGDVIPVMCHAERHEMYAWVTSVGGSPDDAETVRSKVLGARGEHEAEEDLAALAAIEDPAEAELAAEALGERYPGDSRVLFERGAAASAAGADTEAVRLYDAALAAGLRPPFRHRCQIQLAGALHRVGQLDRAREVIEEASAAYPDSLGIAAFRALVEHDAGESTVALSDLLLAITATSADPDVERYRGEIQRAAAALRPDEPGRPWPEAPGWPEAPR